MVQKSRQELELVPNKFYFMEFIIIFDPFGSS